MRLEQLNGFKFIGPLKQGCFIFCPECMVGSCHVDWTAKEGACMECFTRHVSITCPECNAVFGCEEHIFEVAPPFQNYGKE